MPSTGTGVGRGFDERAKKSLGRQEQPPEPVGYYNSRIKNSLPWARSMRQTEKDIKR